ncbi:MAG TPA: hypothetical protein VEJ84_02325 [Acidimicrobiales bacterium]|nr:hypothetical protein [Acidimicrobiales bacterium]
MPPEGRGSAPPGPLLPGSRPGSVAAGSGAGAGIGPPKQPLVLRWLAAFGRFWWDFLVGDTPELLIGVLIALGIVALLVKGASLNAAAVAGFPAMVAVMLGISVYRARPKH